ASNLFLNKFVPHSDNMFVWWNRNEKLHSPSGCELSEGYFGLSLASFGMQYLATPWGGMPEPEELPANSRSLLTGVSALAVPTADYGNIERLIAWSAKVSAVPLEVRGKTKVKTSQFSFDLYVLGEQRVGTTKLPLDA